MQVKGRKKGRVIAVVVVVVEEEVIIAIEVTVVEIVRDMVGKKWVLVKTGSQSFKVLVVELVLEEAVVALLLLNRKEIRGGRGMA